ncbi:MAG: hypothetical protein IJM62_06775 [Lachnospiraceae bacterium]|nr:hypothetical protein [Lachnospiraceae bacterium]
MKKTLRKMIAVIALAAAMIIPVTTNTYAADLKVNDYRMWQTNDPRWGSKLLGNTQGAKTIGNAGCAIVSYAKMLIQAGIKTSAFTPDKANEWAKANGCFYGKNAKNSKGQYIGACISSWAKLANIDSRITYVKAISNPSSATVMGYVNDKDADYDYYMLLECNGGSHYVTLYNAGSKKAGKPVILDCAHAKTAEYNLSASFTRYKITKAYIYKVKVSKAATTTTTTTATPKTSTMAISNKIAPSTIMAKGGAFTIGGKITSNTNIKTVTVSVKTTAGTVKFSKTVSVNAKSYTLYGADGAMKFSSLPVGNYVYEIKATDQLTTKTWKTNFAVRNASITVKNYTCPSGTLTKGNAFSIKGTVNSTNTIKNVTLSVRKTDGTKMFEASATVNAKSYDLHKLDAKMTFKKLPAGTYVYRAAVQDSTGTVKYVLTKSFTVR